MSSEFNVLKNEEIKILEDAIFYITILVAGADNNIDATEKEWAHKIVDIRSYSKKSKVLNHFYDAVEKDFDNRLAKFIDELPKDKSAREAIINEKLSLVNEPIAKLDNYAAYWLYKSYVSLARQIAESSGGFLRFGSVSNDEKKVLGLHMITPIERIYDDNLDIDEEEQELESENEQ
ncbi:MAG: hypothetical protein KBA06_05220 [Saprospiraceae bacterium]|nr:hypothetical protein [Saprospiraceae bacterium]